jgi:hypothetical protein
MPQGAYGQTESPIFYSQYVLFILTICPKSVTHMPMDTYLAPIRNYASSFALVVLRLERDDIILHHSLSF